MKGGKRAVYRFVGEGVVNLGRVSPYAGALIMALLFAGYLSAEEAWVSAMYLLQLKRHAGAQPFRGRTPAPVEGSIAGDGRTSVTQCLT